MSIFHYYLNKNSEKYESSVLFVLFFTRIRRCVKIYDLTVQLFLLILNPRFKFPSYNNIVSLFLLWFIFITFITQNHPIPRIEYSKWQILFNSEEFFNQIETMNEIILVKYFFPPLLSQNLFLMVNHRKPAKNTNLVREFKNNNSTLSIIQSIQNCVWNIYLKQFFYHWWHHLFSSDTNPVNISNQFK